MLRKDLKSLFCDKRFYILAVLACVLTLATMFLGSEDSAAQGIRVGFVNEDTSQYSQLLAEFFSDNENYGEYVDIVQGERTQLEQAVSDGELDLLLVIPEDFTGSLVRLDNKPIRAVISTADQTKAVLINTLLDAYSKYISAVEQNCEALLRVMSDEGMERELVNRKNVEISYELVLKALGNESFFKESETDRLTGVPLTMYYVYVAGFLLLSCCGIYGGLNLYNERSSGMLYRMRTTGRSMTLVVLQKLIFFMLIFGICTIAVLAAAGGMTGEFLRRAAVCIGLLLAMLSVFFLMGSLFSGRRSYIITSNAALLLCLMCGGGIIPVTFMPNELAELAKKLPLYAFIRHMDTAEGSIAYVLVCVAVGVISLALSCVWISRTQDIRVKCAV